MARLNGKKIIFSPHVIIEGEDSTSCTATAADIASGKTARSGGQLVTGTATTEEETYSELISETWGA